MTQRTPLRTARARSLGIRPPVPSGRLEADSSALQSAASVVGTLAPPITIATALLVYFGWARSHSQARYMGLDVSLFGYTTQDYVMRSISTLYVPLLFTAAVGLGGLALHRRVLRALSHTTTRQSIHIVGLTTFGVGLLAVATTVATALVDREWAPLVLPMTLAGGTVTTAYGAWLARAAYDRPDYKTVPAWQRALRILLISGVVTLALFWELSSYAEVVGRGTALELTASVSALPRATAYSTEPLGVEAPNVREERLAVDTTAETDDLRYRTTGLRLLVRSGGRLFFLHDGWSPGHGTVIVLPDNDQISWQFMR